MNESTLDIVIEKKLDELEKTMDDSFNGEISNYIQLRYYMMFFVIGGDDDLISLLERKIRGLTRSRHVFKILAVNDSADTQDRMEEAFRQAADMRINVQDLNTVMVAPVIVSRRLKDVDFAPILQSISEYCGRANKTMQWQPFIILERNVASYPNDLNCLRVVRQFMEKRVAMQQSLEVNRCCLLSRKDENGFTISGEEILQTIAMTAVLQNAVPNDNKENYIRSAIRYDPANDHHDDSFFITVRSASVASPVRSTMLTRMRCAADIYTDCDYEEMSRNMTFTVYFADLLDKYFRLMPNNGKAVSLLPFCGVVSGEGYQKRLHKLSEQYYGAHLARGFHESSNALRARFFTTYFRTGGKLSKLKEACMRGDFNCDASTVPLEDIPLDKVMPELKPEEQMTLRQYYGGYSQRLRTCAGEWSNGLRKLLRNEQQQVIVDRIGDSIDRIQINLKERLDRLHKIEIVLDVGLSETSATSYEVQYKGMRDQGLDKIFDPQFDDVICQMLIDGKIETRIGKLMDICFESARQKVLGDGEFMELLSEECDRDGKKAESHKSTIDSKMKYPVNLVKVERQGNRTFVIGNQNYSFFRKMKELYAAANCLHFDRMARVEILELSAPFSETELQEWKLMTGGVGDAG